MEEELYLDDESCAGCIYRYWIESTELSKRLSGWTCQKTGGYAVIRCKSYVSKDNEQEN